MDEQDSQRLAALFDEHAAKVHRYLRRRVANPAAIDDLVSEVFLTAARKMRAIPEGSELPWLYATARNHASNWRRRAQAQLTEPGMLTRIPDAGNEADAADRLALGEAWVSLSENDKEVLRLAAWEGLSGADLGAALETSSANAASRLSRARSRLVEAIRETAGTP